MISTRRDLLPDDIADELAKLQDRVPPFASAQAVRIIEKSLGLPLQDAFASFDKTALASASIAQVHAVTLLDGRAAVAKVLRPGIRKMINRDIDLLYFLAKLAERYSLEGRRFKPMEMVAEVEHTLLDELIYNAKVRMHRSYGGIFYVRICCTCQKFIGRIVVRMCW